MYSFDSRASFRKSFYAIKSTADLHYGLLNTLNLIFYNGYLYCFCNEYAGRRGDVKCPNEWSAFCSLCKIQVSFKNFVEFLDGNQFNPSCLGDYFFQLFDHLDECFLLNKEVLTVLDEDYEITSRDNYTGLKTSVSVRDYIKWTNEIKKKKRWKEIFYFFLLMFYF